MFGSSVTLALGDKSSNPANSGTGKQPDRATGPGSPLPRRAPTPLDVRGAVNGWTSVAPEDEPAELRPNLIRVSYKRR